MLPLFFTLNYLKMEALQHKATRSAKIPQAGILAWLFERMPEHKVALGAAHVVMEVSEDGRVTGLEISTKDSRAARSMKRLLLSMPTPLAAGRHEIGQQRAQARR